MLHQQGVAAELLDMLERADPRPEVPVRARQGQLKRPRFLPPPRLRGDGSANAGRRLADGERTSRLKKAAAGEQTRSARSTALAAH